MISTRIVIKILSLGLCLVAILLAFKAFMCMNVIRTIDNPYEPHNVAKVVGSLNNIAVILILPLLLCLIAIAILIVWYLVM